LLSTELKKCISLAEQNRKIARNSIDKIPVVIFTTLIDAVNCDYRIFWLMVPYPVKQNYGKMQADSEKLSTAIDNNEE
jgi:hypothetical protein